eukprot:249196-Rhodomonas_salina.1
MRIFDPRTITWTDLSQLVKGDIPSPRMHHRMAAGGNNKIYLHGGLSCVVWGRCCGLAELFEFNTDTLLWVRLPISIAS